MPHSILFIIDELILGGAPVVCYNLIRSLEDTGRFKPCVITLYRKGPLGEALENDGVPLLCLELRHPFGPIKIKSTLPNIVDFARNHNACLVHAHLTASGLYGGLAARALKVPGLFTAHGELSKQIPFRLFEIGMRHLWKTVVGVSEGIAGEIRRCSFFGKGRRFSHIYNGIDTSYWNARAQADRFPKDGKRICVTMVANFFKEKDHDTALESFRLFRKKYKDSVLILAGEGEGRSRIERQVHEMGLRQVIFAGKVEDIKALLDQTDIFLLASLSEGISIAVLEAMAMGLPVIVSDVGSMGEVITNGLDGILVGPEDPKALFDALDHVVGRSEFRNSIRKNARRRVVSAFSVDAMSKAYTALYRNLVYME